MRLFGHPVHVMLVHFPIALWPAHAALHLFAGQLPAGTAPVAFWLLVAGTALAWLAVFCGAGDLIALSQQQDQAPFRSGMIHALINGSVTVGFTAIVALEYQAYPHVEHGKAFVVAELAWLALMFAGNYFGGAIVWGRATTPSP